MTLRRTFSSFAVCAVFSWGLCGCPQSDNGQPAADGVATSDDHGHQHDHDHPSHGPHDGDLIELGHEFHAELLHTDDEVTVYILDGAAANTVAIEATEILLNHVHDGTPMQFTLEASPAAGDPEGRSSRFVSGEPELRVHIEEERGVFRLAVTIEGKAYNGRYEHAHDHHGHSHEH